MPTLRRLLRRLAEPRMLLWFYVLQLIFWTVWTWVCSPWGLGFGIALAQQTQYVTLISHIALVLTMLGAVAAQVGVVKQYEDADVAEVLEAVEGVASDRAAE